MASVAPTDLDRPRPSVFLSYASEDREEARAIGNALPAFGLDVWYDESDLGGGDAWDQKIRKQIRECDYFMPLVSAQTEARHEGYFRREWRLAVERTLDMADDRIFLVPVVIDDTDQAGARVPEKFLAVQWLRLPGGRPTPALEGLCRRMVSGETKRPQPLRHTPIGSGKASSPPRTLAYPEFPRQEPGQSVRFWVHVVEWVFRSAWVLFNRWPKWIRIIACLWLGFALMSRACSGRHHESAQISPADVQKLKAISQQYQGSSNKADIAKLGMQIAREFSGDPGRNGTERSPLLAIPFAAAAGDPTTDKIADSAFALVYGRVAISHRGQVGLSKETLTSSDLGPALERARANHSAYVLWGAIDGHASAQVLTVKIASVADGSVLWSKSYPTAGADPAMIAAEVNSNIPSLDDDS